MFIDELLDILIESYNVDTERIFGQGHSSGGIFLHSWTTGGSKAPQIIDDGYEIKHEKPFRALSTSGSNFFVGGDRRALESAYDASQPVVDAPDEWSSASGAISLLHLHGTEDYSQPYALAEGTISVTDRGKLKDLTGATVAGMGSTVFFAESSGRNWYPVHNDDPSTPGEATTNKYADAMKCASFTSDDSDSAWTKYVHASCEEPDQVVEVRKIIGGSHKSSNEHAAIQFAFFSRFCSTQTLCAWGEYCTDEGSWHARHFWMLRWSRPTVNRQDAAW